MGLGRRRCERQAVPVERPGSVAAPRSGGEAVGEAERQALFETAGRDVEGRAWTGREHDGVTWNMEDFGMSGSIRLVQAALLGALGGCVSPAEVKDDSDSASPTPSTPSTPLERCDVREPLLYAGVPSGLEQCPDGSIDRASAGTFDPTIPDERCHGDEYDRACTLDSDCTAGAHGACLTTYVSRYSSETACRCSYSCATDADCASGKVCVPPAFFFYPHEAFPICVAATCTTDADCPSGECGVGGDCSASLSCRTPADECRIDGDCTAGTGSGTSQACDPGTWTCEESFPCYDGRPLLVEGAPRLAPAVPGHEWPERFPAAGEIDASTRATLARHWARSAAFEHASVGSFARFTLQLLALGAPPDLLADTQSAALDEVRHARLAYGLAARYGGVAMGPGPLPLEGAAPRLDARSAALGLVEEACIGEAFAAVELAEAAAGCQDPVVATTLRALSADETRHAALAWRSLRWILAERAPELADEVRAAVRAALARALEEPMGEVDEPGGLVAHGVLAPRQRLQLFRAAASTVILPCLDAVLSGERGPGEAVRQSGPVSWGA